MQIPRHSRNPGPARTPGRKFSSRTSARSISSHRIRFPASRFEVQPKAFLASIDGVEVRADAAHKGRSPQSRIVPVRRRLDLDDLRSHIGEHHAANRDPTGSVTGRQQTDHPTVAWRRIIAESTRGAKCSWAEILWKFCVFSALNGVPGSPAHLVGWRFPQISSKNAFHSKVKSVRIAPFQQLMALASGLHHAGGIFICYREPTDTLRTRRPRHRMVTTSAMPGRTKLCCALSPPERDSSGKLRRFAALQRLNKVRDQRPRHRCCSGSLQFHACRSRRPRLAE